MNTDSQTKACSRCGAPLTQDALGGLCPRCLMALNLLSETQASGEPDPHGTRVNPPSAKSSPPPEEIAKHFPQFEILECLGRGGMGVVYKAVQKSLDRVVALKILAPEREKDTQFAERFVREAKTLAQLSHPNIVTVHDFGEAGGMFYLVMEFVDGVNLRQLLRDRKLAPEEALAIVPPVCDALQYAHNQGVVHRDIKPENLLLDRQGQIKIADFGIAKILGRRGRSTPPAPPEGVGTSTKTAAGASSSGARVGRATEEERVGTPQYMAPEQMSNPAKVDHRADIYSLGVVLYEMLTGELPAGPLQPPSARMGGVRVDVRIDEIVLRALENEPERRYQTATQFKTRVETVTGGQPASPAEAAAQNAAPEPASAPPAAPAFAKTPSGPIWPTVAALSIVIYFAMMVLGVGIGFAMPWVGGLNIALCALSLVALPFIVVVADRRVRHWLYGSQPGEPAPGLHWLKAWGWTAAILALPVCGFGLFFLNALFSEAGHWNPAPDEALLVPLNWLGSVLLPLAAWILLRTPPRFGGSLANSQSAIRNPQSAMGPPQSGINRRVAYTAVAAVLLVGVLTLAGLLAGQADRRARKEQQAADLKMDELRKRASIDHPTLHRTSGQEPVTLQYSTSSDFFPAGANPERVGDYPKPAPVAWRYAAGGEAKPVPAGNDLKPWNGQLVASAEVPVAEQTNRPFPSVESLPGAVTFHGRYKHRSRGQDIDTPSELWLKETPEGAIAALAQVPFMNGMEVAEGNKENPFSRYLSGSEASGGRPGSRIGIEFRDGTALLTRRGIRQDCDAKELKLPKGALFDPNSRPDSYCAANLLLRAFALGNGESKEFRMADWDNTGDALSDYTIQIKNTGKDRVEVPAGTFQANHLVLTQTSTGNTWYKKRAGHVTDFWVLDNHVIVRILRAREPYEVLLLDYTTPDKLPGLEAASAEKTTALKTPAVAQQPLPPLPSAESLPGTVTFHGRYKHRNRGQDIDTPSDVWVKETPEGAIAALAQVPFMNSTDLAEGNKEQPLLRYFTGQNGTGTPGYRIDLKFLNGAAQLTRQGLRQDADAKALKMPEGALFDPNTRPDSYCAANLLLRAFALGNGESKEFRMADWDNSGDALSDYTIRIKNIGKERVEVPAGAFQANHLVLTQTSTGNTWYKKRAGHVTDFWVLDNHVIVRILRAREPYEMLLLDYTVPDKLPGLEPASTPVPTSATGQPAPASAVQPLLQPLPSVEDLPGTVTFQGRYKHRSRGQDIEAPSKLSLKETPEGAVLALAEVPFMNATEVAEGNRENRFVRHLTGSEPSGGRPGYRILLEFRNDMALLTRHGVRQDCDAKELKMPEGALFDPNSRPDSYCAANLLLRAFALAKGESKDFRMADWDNTGDALSDYTIQIKNTGKERVEVPAGAFQANHLVLTQTSTGNTWYKKRAGHVTDFWVLDNHVIVRILRAREPYEVRLLDYTVPDKLPGHEPAKAAQ